MKSRHYLPAMALLGLTSSAFALKIEIRYDHDPNGFFANNPQAKVALRAAADFYEPLIHDSLLAINPAASGYTWSARIPHPTTGDTGYLIPGLVVPADTIIIFASGRALGTPAARGGPGGQNISGDGNWISRILYRGQAGAAATPATDFARWGGYVTFNTSKAWNFSLTDPDAEGVPFLSAALHEIGHVLGIGESASVTPSWANKVVNNHFTGAHAVQAYGGNVPLDTQFPGHWLDNDEEEEEPGILSKTYGAFATPHGTTQNGLMDPELPPAGDFYAVVTDLDLAALRDIGWEVEPPLKLTAPTIKPSASPYLFSWPSSTGYTYRLQRSTALAPGTWTDLSTQPGNGSMQQFSTTVPAGLSKVFYRLTTEPPAAPAMAMAAPLSAPPAPQAVVFDIVDPEGGVEGCGCSDH